MWLGRRPCGWQSAETKLFADSLILAIIIISSSILNRTGAVVSWIFRFHFLKSYSSFVLRATLPIVTKAELFAVLHHNPLVKQQLHYPVKKS